MEEKDNSKITVRLPLWAGRITTPVKVTDLSRQRSFDGGKALWDTGSQVSIISEDIAKACHLKTVSDGEGQGITGKAKLKLGVVLIFPGDVRKFIPISADVIDLKDHDIDVILGMDIIGRGDFSILRKDGYLEMTFVFGEDFMDA